MKGAVLPDGSKVTKVSSRLGLSGISKTVAGDLTAFAIPCIREVSVNSETYSKVIDLQ